MSDGRSFLDRILANHFVVGAVTSIVLLVVVVGNFTGGLRKLFSGHSTHTIVATFANVQQLRNGAEVRIDGLNAGNVTQIVSTPGDRGALVSMAIDRSAGPIYGDADASLRWKTILGDSFYVEVDRGHPGSGGLAATGIPVSRTSDQIELDDVTSIFNDGAFSGLQTLPGQLAIALSDHNAPAATLGELAHISPALASGVGALRGVVTDQDLQTLVASTAKTTSILARSPSALRGLVSGAATTLQTTAASAGAIEATLERSPAVMSLTNTTLAALRHTLNLADPLIAHLQQPATQVAPTLSALHPTVVSADRLLHNAVPLLDSLKPSVTSLASASRAGLPLLNAVQPSLDRADDTILPYLAAKAPDTGESTSVMIGGTFEGLGAGAAGQEDANGHFIRFPATSGSSPLYLPCSVYIGNPDDAARLIECQSLQTALNTLLSYNPLTPTPGSAP